MLKPASSYLILLGVLAVIVGIIALAWPEVTVLALAGLFSLVYGVSQITTGIELRRSGQTLDKVLDHAG